MSTEWCFKTDLKLWNEKPKLGHLAYEMAMLCFECIQSKFYWNILMKLGYELTWMRFAWSLDISLIKHVLVMCPNFGLWNLSSQRQAQRDKWMKVKGET